MNRRELLIFLAAAGVLVIGGLVWLLGTYAPYVLVAAGAVMFVASFFINVKDGT